MIFRRYVLCLCVFVCNMGISGFAHSEPTQSTLFPDDKDAEQQQMSALYAHVPHTSPFTEWEYDQLVLKMYVASNNIPSYWLEKGIWQRKEKNCEVSGGKDEVVSPYQLNVIRKVHYYRYKNDHPLDSEYFMHDEKSIAFLKRFCFYRFTGKTLLPSLDVCLFALDMHTGLVFRYALPSRFDRVLRNTIARDWVALEQHPSVQKTFPNKKFYEFDPIGMVQKNGKILLYDWVIELNKQKHAGIAQYMPHLDYYEHTASAAGPGYSPYRRN